MALTGLVPVSIFPRWNFVLCAINQLVNHLDKVQAMSNGGYKVKAIVRTAIGSQRAAPAAAACGRLHRGGPVHVHDNRSDRLEEPYEIFPAYEKALLRDDGRSTILVEYGDYYGEK